MKKFVSIIIAIIATVALSTLAMAETFTAQEAVDLTVIQRDGITHRVRTSVGANDTVVFSGNATVLVYANNRGFASEINGDANGKVGVSESASISATITNDQGHIVARKGRMVASAKTRSYTGMITVYESAEDGLFYLVPFGENAQMNNAPVKKATQPSSPAQPAKPTDDGKKEEVAQPTIPSKSGEYALPTIGDKSASSEVAQPTIGGSQTTATSEEVKVKYNFTETKSEVAQPTIGSNTFSSEAAKPTIGSPAPSITNTNSTADQIKSKYGF
ncbi:MAG: hypothetical protein IJ217_03785 [Clostridia bacterium]|nr:hypothetical protein [Clostridia bacterium]